MTQPFPQNRALNIALRTKPFTQEVLGDCLMPGPQHHLQTLPIGLLDYPLLPGATTSAALLELNLLASRTFSILPLEKLC